MRRRVEVFIFGLVLGLGLQYLISSHQKKLQKAAEENQAVIENIQPEEKPVKNYAMSTKVEKVQIQRDLPTTPARVVQNVQDEKTKEDDGDAKHTIELSINEESIRMLEAHWDELRQLARAEITGDGWRIHLLTVNSVFTDIGINDLDHINYQQFVAQYGSQGDPQLVNRMVNIFNHIAQ
jgi:predicted RNase H-like nuclease (RuvC/YqgF family)